MKRKRSSIKKMWLAAVPFLAVFAFVLLVVVVIRSKGSAKRNGVTWFAMIWYEIKFLFSFDEFAPKIE